jgi:hypothetical protein
MPLDRSTLDNLLQGDANQRAIADARATIAESNCVLFAGAGTSRSSGYPLWGQLLENLTSVLANLSIDTSNIRSTDPLVAAEEIYDCYAANGKLSLYHSVLCNTFEPNGQSLELQKLLLSIPFRGVVTPNYDDCFERAIHELRPTRENVSPMYKIDKNHAKHVRHFFDSLRKQTKGVCVAHLHGVYDEPQNIVITQRQYIEAYGGSREQLQPGQFSGSPGDWTLLRKTLWALIASQRLIFVGFSMTDPFIDALMQYVGDDLWDMTAPTHYFVTHVSSNTTHDPTINARTLLIRLGVRTIFYEVVGDDHSGLTDVLRKFGATERTSLPSAATVSALLGPPV